MNTLAQYALLGAIVAVALGALLVCVLAGAYGFTPPEAQPEVERRRRRITRLGHILAAGAFGMAGLLAFTGVFAAMAPTPAVPQLRALQERVSGMASMLHGMADAADRLRARGDRLAAATPGGGAGTGVALPERKRPERPEQPPAGSDPGSRPAPAGAAAPRPPEPTQEAAASRYLELTRIERLERLERVDDGE